MATKQRNIVFLFLVLIFFAVCFVYAIPGFHALAAIPPLNLVIITRFNLVNCFALAALGALGMQGLFFERVTSLAVSTAESSALADTPPRRSRDGATVRGAARGSLDPAPSCSAASHSGSGMPKRRPTPRVRLLFVRFFYSLDASKTSPWVDSNLKVGGLSRG